MQAELGRRGLAISGLVEHKRPGERRDGLAYLFELTLWKYKGLKKGPPRTAFYNAPVDLSLYSKTLSLYLSENHTSAAWTMVEPSGGRSEVKELRDVKRKRFGEGSMQERNIGAASRGPATMANRCLIIWSHFWAAFNELYWECTAEGLARRRRCRSVKADSRPRAQGDDSLAESIRRSVRPQNRNDACLAPLGAVLIEFGFGARGRPFAENGLDEEAHQILRGSWAYCSASGEFAKTWHGLLALLEADCAFGLIAADRAEAGDQARRGVGDAMAGMGRHSSVRDRKGDVGDLFGMVLSEVTRILMVIKLEPYRFVSILLEGPDALESAPRRLPT